MEKELSSDGEALSITDGGHTEIGIRDKKNIPNTVSVLGILFHEKNIPNTVTVLGILSLLSKTVLGILFQDHDGIFY